jgi:hypothetical protein
MPTYFFCKEKKNYNQVQKDPENTDGPNMVVVSRCLLPSRLGLETAPSQPGSHHMLVQRTFALQCCCCRVADKKSREKEIFSSTIVSINLDK